MKGNNKPSAYKSNRTLSLRPPRADCGTITYWDIKIGDFIKVSGQARNAYEITSKSQKQICMRRMKDGLEHCMETERVLEMNKHLIGNN